MIDFVFAIKNKVCNFRKLKRYLALADDTIDLADNTIKKISYKLQRESKAIPFRERVLIGLGRKMFSSFECLREDARKGKLEAHHHLKTLIESFIYFYWIIQDTDDIKAKLVLAEGIRKKIARFKNNPEYPDHEKYVQSYNECLNSLVHDISTEWKNFKEKGIEQLANESQLKGIYSRIYRLACEPAHISDLPEFMPRHEGPITLNHPQTSMLSVIVALDYGIYIFCDILKYGSDFYELRLDESISELRTRYYTIRTQKGRGRGHWF